MSTTSTGSRATSFASDTVVAVPTMLMSGSSLRTRARDSRIRRWSSTSSTRTGRGLAALSERVTGPGSGAAPSPECSIDDTNGALSGAHCPKGIAAGRPRRMSLRPPVMKSRRVLLGSRPLPDNRSMRVAFLGLGLIGGSVARALREDDGFRDDELVAWSPSGKGPREALEQGVLDAIAGDPGVAVDGAGLVVLAGPPLACIALLERLGGELRDALAPGSTVTDVASTKAALTRAADRAQVPYVGGHPMAGRETTGFGAADAQRFRVRRWVTPQPIAGGDPEAVRRLAVACGAQPVTIDAERHDVLVAGISHLPLLASVALVEAVAGARDEGDPDWPAARALAAGGWRDTTRLARGDARMGAEIAATNAPALVDLVRRYRDRLDAFLADLEAADGPDADALEARLARAAQRAATES